MEFYEFSPSCASKYVSAINLTNANLATYSDCDVCGNKGLIDWNSFKPVFECETITSRRSLPDIMLYGGRIIHSFDWWYIVSEAFKEFCETNSIKGVTFSEVSLVCSKRNIISELPPKYYLMLIYGRTQLDYKKMGVECYICQKCCHYVYSTEFFPLYDPQGIYPTVLDESTWDGSDVFDHGGCTESFVKKICGTKLNGFDFLPYKQKFDVSSNKHYISH